MDEMDDASAGPVGYDSAAGFNGALSGRNSNCEAIVQIPLKSLPSGTRSMLPTRCWSKLSHAPTSTIW